MHSREEYSLVQDTQLMCAGITWSEGNRKVIWTPEARDTLRELLLLALQGHLPGKLALQVLLSAY